MIRLIVFIGLSLSMYAQSTNYDTLVQQGKTQLQAGSNTQALASGQQAIQLDATRWEAYALTGGALMNLHRYEEAADQLSHAIDHAPEAKQPGLRDLRKQCALAESGVAPKPEQPTQPASTTQAEIVLWKTIENSQNADDFNGYLTQYPNGAFVVLAKKHLSDLETIKQQQLDQIALAKSREPIGTPIAGGTVVKVWDGQSFFTPGLFTEEKDLGLGECNIWKCGIYLVKYEGEPSFLLPWNIGKLGGNLLILKTRFILQCGDELISSPIADLPIKPGGYGYVWMLLNNKCSGNYKKLNLPTRPPDANFILALRDHWEDTMQQFVSDGIDMNKIPDFKTWNWQVAKTNFDQWTAAHPDSAAATAPKTYPGGGRVKH